MKRLDFKVNGFLFPGISAGIKKDGKRDLGFIYSQVPAQVAGLFTTNAVKAAPVLLDRQRIKGGVCQAVMIRSFDAKTGQKLWEFDSNPKDWAWPKSRNELILNDVIASLEEGRCPILLTERKDHLAYFAERLQKFARHLVCSTGA